MQVRLIFLYEAARPEDACMVADRLALDFSPAQRIEELGAGCYLFLASRPAFWTEFSDFIPHMLRLETLFAQKNLQVKLRAGYLLPEQLVLQADVDDPMRVAVGPDSWLRIAAISTDGAWQEVSPRMAAIDKAVWPTMAEKLTLFTR